jgi:hypothetical protein
LNLAKPAHPKTSDNMKTAAPKANPVMTLISLKLLRFNNTYKITAPTPTNNTKYTALPNEPTPSGKTVTFANSTGADA